MLNGLMDVPIVGAPLAGGPSTPALAAAVSDAGGLGFIAAGYKTAREVGDDIAAVRAVTDRPFGVNLFFPGKADVDEQALAGYARRVQPEAERYGVECGEPSWSDDDWDAKLELVARERPPVVSFTFGCPSAELVRSLRANDIRVWCTITTPAEARVAAAAGVDALIVQGAEAGGHQSSFDDTDNAAIPLASLLPLVQRATPTPLIAAGGIATGAAVGSMLAAGAAAAQIGTALLRTPEAGTSEPHRNALGTTSPTAFTRAFSGRRARGIVNRFMREHDASAPRAYPHVHYLTAPIRAAARAAGDADTINLWAGEAHRLARAAPAGELVAEWAAECRR